MFGLNARQLFGLLVFIALIYAAIQYGPPYVEAYEFSDFIRQEVKYAGSARRTPAKVSASIIEKAKELNIPVTARDIRVTRRGPAFTIDVEYRVPINMRIYRHELVFHSTETGEVFE